MNVTLDRADGHFQRLAYVGDRKVLDETEQKNVPLWLFEMTHRFQHPLQLLPISSGIRRRRTRIADIPRLGKRQMLLFLTSPAPLLNVAGRGENIGPQLTGAASHVGQRSDELHERICRLFLGRVMIAVITKEKTVQRPLEPFDKQLVGV